jgi:hypothetical protein
MDQTAILQTSIDGRGLRPSGTSFRAGQKLLCEEPSLALPALNRNDSQAKGKVDSLLDAVATQSSQDMNFFRLLVYKKSVQAVQQLFSGGLFTGVA